MQRQGITSSTFGHSISPYAEGTLTAKTRWLLSAGVRMGTIDGDTGKVHGPVASSVDCGCGWGKLCDAPDGQLCGATAERGVHRPSIGR